MVEEEGEGGGRGGEGEEEWEGRRKGLDVRARRGDW